MGLLLWPGTKTKILNMALPENISSLNKQKVFLFASKMNFEDEFFFRVIAGTVNGKNAEFRANRLKSHFLGRDDMNWYCTEINLPVYKEAQAKVMPPDADSFDGVTWKPAAINFEF